MKYLIILAFFFSCCSPKKTMNVLPGATIVKVDTVYIHDTIEFIAHAPIPDPDKDYLIDSLKTRITLLSFKIERVKYYLKICQRKPSQTKFLVSWINRAIN